MNPAAQYVGETGIHWYAKLWVGSWMLVPWWENQSSGRGQGRKSNKGLECSQQIAQDNAKGQRRSRHQDAEERMIVLVCQAGKLKMSMSMSNQPAKLTVKVFETLNLAHIADKIKCIGCHEKNISLEEWILSPNRSFIKHDQQQSKLEWM